MREICPDETDATQYILVQDSIITQSVLCALDKGYIAIREVIIKWLDENFRQHPALLLAVHSQVPICSTMHALSIW